MRATRTLPDGFVLGGTLQLAGNQRLKVLLNLLAVPWLLLAVLVNGLLAALVRPGGWSFAVDDVVPPLLLLGVVLGLVTTFALTIVLHEAAHGLILWAHTGARPVFGFKGWYIYTDAPGWYVGRPAMLVTLAAPLVLVPAVGLPLVAWAPPGVSLLALVALVVNMTVAIGDVYSMVFVLRLRGPVIFGDEGGPPGEAGSWYVPSSSRDVEPV
jgi:hypothetical protein